MFWKILQTVAIVPGCLHPVKLTYKERKLEIKVWSLQQVHLYTVITKKLKCYSKKKDLSWC